MYSRYGPCQLDGCANPRHKVGRYCQKHRKAYARYGHPLGRPVDLASLLNCAVRARIVLNAHADTHAGLKLAIEELSRALNEARIRDTGAPQHIANPRSHAATDRNVVAQFARLASQGVSPLDVLTMIAAVALLDHTDTGRFPDTRAYRYGVARAVCGLVPRPNAKRPIGSNTLAAIGAFLAERYSTLMGVIVRTVMEDEHREAVRRAAMSAPLQSLPSTHTNL